MEKERTPPIKNTKRCLFPEDDMDSSQSSSVFFHIGAVESPLKTATTSQDDSPTAVQEYPMHSGTQKTSIRSRIAMSDYGAEVLVDMSMLSIHTPEKEEGFRRTHSLLDTQSPATKSMDDSFVYNVVEDSPFGKCYHNATSSPFGLQTSIALCLGDAEEDFQAAASGCHSWKPWVYFGSSEEKSESPRQSPSKTRLANRVIDRQARKIRIQHIRRELNPFAKTPVKSTDFAKTRSLSITPQARAEETGQRKYTKSTTPSNQKRRSSGFSDVIQLCTMPENEATSSPIILRKNSYYGDGGNDLDEFYDSDPEDFARTRQTPNNRKGKKGVYHRGVATTPPGQSNDIYHDESFCTVAQEFINSTSTLIYHPTKNTRASSQVVVSAWIERGQDFGQSLIQPKWMWKSESRYSNCCQSMNQVNGIELLRVVRILKVDQIDRSLHPFAKPSSCFLIRTVDGDEFVFEAESKLERDHMVYAMKIVIARFGAMVLNQDDDIHEEFFATSDPVPGSIPSVLNRTKV